MDRLMWAVLFLLLAAWNGCTAYNLLFVNSQIGLGLAAAGVTIVLAALAVFNICNFIFMRRYQ